jgi:hypothetical protein
MTRFGNSFRPKSAARSFLALVAFGTAACSETARPTEWPDGAVLVARTGSLRDVMADLTQLTGTPLARAVKARVTHLPDCEIVQAHAPSGTLSELFDELSCRDAPGALDVVNRARGDHDLLIALPAVKGSRIHIAAHVGSERVELTIGWPGAPEEGVLSLLLPGDEPAGPSELARGGRLAHMRVRPASGIDLAALVPAESQADRLFGLRNELFAGVALDGTWEAAIYLPEPGHSVPRSALALGFNVRSVALAAIERFVERIATTWSVRSSAFSLGSASGACLLEMNVLPELAPCYVATERTLVVGWNAQSVVAALAGHDENSPSAPDAGGIAELDLALFAEADEILRQQFGTETTPGFNSLPWRHLVAQGGRENGALQIEIALERSEPK